MKEPTCLVTLESVLARERLLSTIYKNWMRNVYNTQFIDTTVQFRESVYFTCIRLVCIGTYLIRIYIRARDVSENNPSVHNKDTPKDRELLDYLHEKLVVPRLEAFHALSDRIGRVLGPGFYAHDVLIENKTGQLFLCETGFKFYDDTYEEPDDRCSGR